MKKLIIEIPKAFTDTTASDQIEMFKKSFEKGQTVILWNTVTDQKFEYSPDRDIEELTIFMIEAMTNYLIDTLGMVGAELFLKRSVDEEMYENAAIIKRVIDCRFG